MHLEEERIQRALHGELDPAAQEDVERHLAECAPCRQRLEDAGREEQWIFEQLRLVDHAVPAVDAGKIVARSGERLSGWRPGSILGNSSRAPRRALRLQWAAAILLALAAAGVAYTMPGSPVRAWVDRAVDWASGNAPAGSVETSASPAPAAPSTSGIAVAPGERFTIRFAAAQPEGRAAVTLAAGPDVTVRAAGGTVNFTTDVDRLVIENAGARADYEIEIPKDAPWVEILVDDRRVLLKEGERIVTDAPADAQARYLLPVSPAGP
jgi:hypothetical protein